MRKARRLYVLHHLFSSNTNGPAVGALLRSPPSHKKRIEDRLRECTALKVKPDDVEMVTSLIRECARLDPSQRPTADELVRHPWFWDTYMVGSTYEAHMHLSPSTSGSM